MPANVAAPPQQKSVRFVEFKTADDERGIFEGYLSVYGNVDSYKDIVEPGAFTKTIKDARGRNAKYLFPLLWQHDPKDPIGGILDMKETPKGLYIQAQIDLNTPHGAQAYSGLKMGYLDGLSFGYDTIKHKYEGDIRHLLEVRMWEGSVVTFPANDDTRVTGVKSACGSTSWPLGDRGEAWDGGAAHNQIVQWATKDDDTLDAGKMKSVHFYVDDGADTSLAGSYKMPFCYIRNGSPVAIPRGIMACAAVMQGARGGGNFSGDDSVMKSKIATYYRRMAKQFNDPDIKVPWAPDKSRTMQKKLLTPTPRLFTAVLNDRSASDVLEDLYDLVTALMTSIMEQVAGSQDDATCKTNVDTCMTQFSTAVDAWLKEALSATMSDTDELDISMSVSESPSESVSGSVSGSLSGSVSGSASGSMSSSKDAQARTIKHRRMRLSLAHFSVSTSALKSAMRCYIKEGRTLSTASRTRMSAALDSIQTACKDLQAMIDENDVDGDTDPDTNPGKNNPAPDKNPGTPASLKPGSQSKPSLDDIQGQTIVDGGMQPTDAQKQSPAEPFNDTPDEPDERKSAEDTEDEQILELEMQRLLKQMKAYASRG